MDRETILKCLGKTKEQDENWFVQNNPAYARYKQTMIKDNNTEGSIKQGVDSSTTITFGDNPYNLPF